LIGQVWAWHERCVAFKAILSILAIKLIVLMSTPRFFILLVVLVIPTLSVQAQKVKYKDIYVWLSNKQYSEAEPFLKRYLKENDDNPNAFLYMGFTYENKALKNDVLKESKATLYNLDSALFYLDKAYKTITEKELKRNAEYYESFKRRDFRVGTEGIKLSDVQFTIETKQQELKERIDKVKLINYYFLTSDTLYKKSQQLFASIKSQFKTSKSLFLQADKPTIEALEKLSERFDSCTKAFDIYKTNIQGLGKTGYNQEIDLKEIQEIAKDGLSTVDFHDNKLSLWDYKIFADKSIKQIKQDIMPLREELVGFDININKLRTKLGNDSVSVHSDLEKLQSAYPFEKLQKYDADPLPSHVFHIKVAELAYRSLLAEHKPYRDSADVHLKVRLAKAELNAIKALDSLSAHITIDMVDRAAVDYSHFIANTYSSVAVLKSYVKGLQDYSQRDRSLKEFEVAFRQAGTRWLLIGTDSVALVLNPGVRYTHQPLSVVQEKFTSGLVYKDTANVSGYFYSITPSRKPDIGITFPIEKPFYTASKLSKAKSFIVSDPAGQIFFVVLYSENRLKDKVPVTVAKIYRSDGLAWSSNLLLASYPTSAIFGNGELIVSLVEGTNVIIDKNGKMK
jgi:hypothetical protein